MDCFKPISQVQVGDQVESRDPQTGQEGAKTVTATIKRLAPAVVTVTLADPQAHQVVETLTCTPEHPLYVQSQGWVEAGSLGIGTSIISRAGPALSVQSVTWQRGKADEKSSGSGGYTVYNLTVEDDHTFFVGVAGGGTWVHNAVPCDITPGLAKVRQIHDERFMNDGIAADKYNTTAVLETNAGDYVGVSGKGLHAEEDAIAQARSDGLADGDLNVINVSRPPCPGRCTPLLQGIGLTARYWLGKAGATLQSSW